MAWGRATSVRVMESLCVLRFRKGLGFGVRSHLRETGQKEFEDAFTRRSWSWLATCHPDDQVDAAARVADLDGRMEDANSDQRARLASSMSEVQAKTGPQSRSGLDPAGLLNSRSCWRRCVLGAGDECWAHARPRMVWHTTCSDGVVLQPGFDNLFDTSKSR